MPHVLRIYQRMDGDMDLSGLYVKAYDPTVHLADGTYDGGILEVTADISEALKFDNHVEALEKWRQPAGCSCHGTRPWDGRPNRPLTAWTVEVLPCN